VGVSISHLAFCTLSVFGWETDTACVRRQWREPHLLGGLLGPQRGGCGAVLPSQCQYGSAKCEAISPSASTSRPIGMPVAPNSHLMRMPSCLSSTSELAPAPGWRLPCRWRPPTASVSLQAGGPAGLGEQGPQRQSLLAHFARSRSCGVQRTATRTMNPARSVAATRRGFRVCWLHFQTALLALRPAL
jgi:hypothetical protein